MSEDSSNKDLVHSDSVDCNDTSALNEEENINSSINESREASICNDGDLSLATPSENLNETQEEKQIDEKSKEVVNDEKPKDDSNQFLTPPVPCFEEDTRSSWAVDTSKNEQEITFNDSVVDEDSQQSFNSQQSSNKRKVEDEDESSKFESTFPVENLFEYQWPPEKGEFYILQEQISDYLGIKSFKRKYPELSRRLADPDEKEFLKERGVVTEMQCDLGLTALRSEDVMDLMCKDYPDKYSEYVRVLQEKERQSIKEKHKEYATPNIDKGKIDEYVKKAIHSAAEYNAHLNHERREERKACFDLQTFTILYPLNKRRKIETNTKMGKFPVALLPGQYQDYYRVYSSQELKYLPINTVLYGPPKELGTVYSQPESDNQSESDESSSEEESSSTTESEGSESSTESDITPNGFSNNSHSSSNYSLTNSKVSLNNSNYYKPKHKIHALCTICQHGDGRTKDGRNEHLVHCALCETSGHPSCLDMTSEVASVVHTYPWQCEECKICSSCMDPTIDEEMIRCDHCDRGYHASCAIDAPTGSTRWICKICAQCVLCASKTPGPSEGSKASWQLELIKIGDSPKKPHIVCTPCFKHRKMGKTA